MRQLCESLLKEWCESLLRLQITGTGNPRLDGAIQCPACGRIHGRCFEAMYPFLCMAELEHDEKWAEAAKRLFDWAENVVSLPEGSFINDIESDWKGTTVFETIQLADCLLLHSRLLSEDTQRKWKARLKKAADFLYDFESLNNNNINYPISNALALCECGEVFGEERYVERAKRLAALAEPVFTENGLLFGEGVPRFLISPRGCRPVDIGYNVEETLPSLAMYGAISGDEESLKLAEKGLLAQLEFMLENGAWDNSFGTRNFKWTYWGSRTSDGCAMGYLLLADSHPEFAAAAMRNIELLKKCTFDGLLAGGPHYQQAGQPPCSHHTFTHAKVLAGILDRRLWEKWEKWENGENSKMPGSRLGGRFALPGKQAFGLRHYPEIDTWLVNLHSMTATVTAYDWEYLPGGHAMGGTLSLLHHNEAGTLLCSGIADYTMKEPNNMQIPYQVKHECLALRIEAEIEGVLYSSLYENEAEAEVSECGGDNPESAVRTLTFRGRLKDISHQPAPGKALSYRIQYRFEEDKLTVEADFEEGKLICPVISGADESIAGQAQPRKAGMEVIQSEPGNEECNFLRIHKKGARVELRASHKMNLPYGQERIFNLVPGLQALKIEIEPTKNQGPLPESQSFQRPIRLELTVR